MRSVRVPALPRGARLPRSAAASRSTRCSHRAGGSSMRLVSRLPLCSPNCCSTAGGRGTGRLCPRIYLHVSRLRATAKTLAEGAKREYAPEQEPKDAQASKVTLSQSSRRSPQGTEARARVRRRGNSRCEAAFERSRTGALQIGDRLMRSRGGPEPSATPRPITTSGAPDMQGRAASRSRSAASPAEPTSLSVTTPQPLAQEVAVRADVRRANSMKTSSYPAVS